MDIKVRICDRCGKEERGKNAYHVDGGYGEVRISLYGGSEKLYATKQNDYIHLCPDCMEKIGFHKKVQEAAEQRDVPVIEKIYDIIAEIVADIMQE